MLTIMSFSQSLQYHFPQSNLDASLCEVWADYELHICTWLGYDKHSKQELQKVAKLAADVFEDLFLGYSEPLYALINQWDTRRIFICLINLRGLMRAITRLGNHLMKLMR